MDAKELGEKIRQKRQEQNLTQKELAERLHITDKAVSKWERGISFPDISMIELLTKELNLSLAEIFTEAPECRETHEEVNHAIQNTLIFAEEHYARKKRKYQWIGALFFGAPLPIFLILILAAFLGIIFAPESPATETAAFFTLAFFGYMVKLGFPFLFGYLLFVWRDSHFMSMGKKAVIRNWISTAGLLVIVIWLYESFKTILPNLLS